MKALIIYFILYLGLLAISLLTNWFHFSVICTIVAWTMGLLVGGGLFNPPD